jgi:hypothetical protein
VRYVVFSPGADEVLGISILTAMAAHRYRQSAVNPAQAGSFARNSENMRRDYGLD